MSSLVLKEDLIKKVLKDNIKTLFTPEVQRQFDFDRIIFIDRDGDEIEAQLALEIPMKKGEDLDPTELINKLDQTELELSETNKNLDTSLQEINSMREYIAFKGLKYNRDWKAIAISERAEK